MRVRENIKILFVQIDSAILPLLYMSVIGLQLLRHVLPHIPPSNAPVLIDMMFITFMPTYYNSCLLAMILQARILRLCVDDTFRPLFDHFILLISPCLS